MMALTPVSQVCRSQFKTLVTDVVPIPTQFENLPFTRPDTLYVSLSILPGDKRQVSAGKNCRYRQTGIMLARIFGELEKGDGHLIELADFIEDAFRSKTYSNVVFSTPSTNRVGRAGKYWQVNVSCPWYSDFIQ